MIACTNFAPRVAVLLALSLAILTMSMPAHAALFGPEGLDKSFCEQVTYRQTVVYIDDMILADGRTDWITRLGTKLQASLSAGERVTIVRLSPATGESKEIWSGCWPEYTEAKQEELEKETFLFRRNPLLDREDQQKYFLRDFGAGLLTIYRAAKRPLSEVSIDPTSPPTKQLIRALASDEGRFTQSRLTIRAIVYSDLAESSDIGSVFRPLPPRPEDYGVRLGTYLRHSVFYVFGVGGDVRNVAGLQEVTRHFWSDALRSMTATIGGMGADLNVPNAKPVAARLYDVTLKMNAQDVDGKLSILVDNQGALVDSWIGITLLSSTGLSGTFRCKGTGNDAICNLDATTTSSLTTKNQPAELVSLSGKSGSEMKGEIGVKPKYLLPLSARPVDN